MENKHISCVSFIALMLRCEIYSSIMTLGGVSEWAVLLLYASRVGDFIQFHAVCVQFACSPCVTWASSDQRPTVRLIYISKISNGVHTLLWIGSLCRMYPQLPWRGKVAQNRVLRTIQNHETGNQAKEPHTGQSTIKSKAWTVTQERDGHLNYGENVTGLST